MLMAGLGSPHAPQPQPDHSESAGTIARNSQYGVILFFVYLLLYGGFIYLAAFKFEWMSRKLWGANVAIVYGMALIVAAFVLATLYMFLCRSNHEQDGAAS